MADSFPIIPILSLAAISTLAAVVLKDRQTLNEYTSSKGSGYSPQGGKQNNPDEQQFTTYAVDLDGLPSIVSNAGGSEAVANADNSPILIVPGFQILNHWAMSIGITHLKRNGIREPHWHPNALELSYVIDGKAIVTIFNGDSPFVNQSFTVDAGQLFFVPRGFLHHIENISGHDTNIISAWDNERTQSQGLSGMVGAVENRVNDLTFGTSDFFSRLADNRPNDIIMTRKENITSNQATVTTSTPYRYDLENASADLDTPFGTTTKGSTRHFPILANEGISGFSIIYNPRAVREPHWHPNAAELHYVIEGIVKYAVLTPGGGANALERSTVKKGQFFFAPPGYVHYFENASSSERMHLISFFTSSEPQDIGLSGGMSAYSNDVLGASFKSDGQYFERMPRFSKDVGIVSGEG